jgi:hypothetical protein
MSKRYGRNQKRAARERIEHLSTLMHGLYADMEQMHRAAARRDDGMVEAFRRLMAEKDMILNVTGYMAEGLGQAVGKELLPYARKLMLAERKMRGQRPVFSATSGPYDPGDIRVRGSIPEFVFDQPVVLF